jgi:predicted MFS family arabinose efflux permease
MWGAAICSGLILGLVVGIPYFGMPFFYDYFEQAFGWGRPEALLGLPIGTLVTLVLGPLVVKRLPPRGCIVGGALVCGMGLAGFGFMDGSLWAYYGLWTVYMAGWIFAGPLTHQILLTQVFTQNRGTALAVAYFGISLFGAISVALVARPLTAEFGFRGALIGIGLLTMLASPVAWFGLPSVPAAERVVVEGGTGLLGNRSFWLLIVGSTLAISGVAGVSQHLKLILKEAGYVEQARLDAVFGWMLMLMLAVGSCGRFAFAWTADRYPKRHVISVAFLLMAGAMPLLFVVGREGMPYVFAVVFGLGMSADSLMVPLLAADQFGSRGMGRVMAWAMPVNTVGQTWFPYLVSLMWGVYGSYTVPLVFTFGCVLLGRLTLAGLPRKTIR